MRRREFITLLAAAAAWPLPAPAQQAGKVFRIGYLASHTAEGGKDLVGCFRKGLEQLGWIEGRNINIEYRWAGGDAARGREWPCRGPRPAVGTGGGACALGPIARGLRRAGMHFCRESRPVGAPLQYEAEPSS